MRADPAPSSRYLRYCPLPIPLLAGAAALMLAGCQGDAPTADGTSDGSGLPVRPISLAPAAFTAGQLSTHRLVRTFGTIATRTSVRPSSAFGDPVNNSPFDLTYVGGPVVTSARNWNVYVNCDGGPASCWGTGHLTPATFLRDLNRSPFIRIANQYLGTEAAGQFRVSELGISPVPFAPFSITNTTPTATIDDIFAILFSAAAATGATGYTNMYHLFLPQGTDMCIDVGLCYSPDDFLSWVFCAFHGSVDLPDPADPSNPALSIHVLFSVEPYQAVGGCSLPSQAPNGVIDATASTLSHEFFETITDPDLNAWFNFLTGEEVADLCSAFASNERMNNHFYSIQTEYSNKTHLCTNRL